MATISTLRLSTLILLSLSFQLLKRINLAMVAMSLLSITTRFSPVMAAAPFRVGNLGW